MVSVKCKLDRHKIKNAFVGIDRDILAKALIGKKSKHRRNIIDQIASGLTLVSPRRAMAIEKLTKGQVPKEILRPDIFL